MPLRLEPSSLIEPYWAVPSRDGPHFWTHTLCRIRVGARLRHTRTNDTPVQIKNSKWHGRKTSPRTVATLFSKDTRVLPTATSEAQGSGNEPSPRGMTTMVTSVIVRTVDFCARRAWLVVAYSVLLAAASLTTALLTFRSTRIPRSSFHVTSPGASARRAILTHSPKAVYSSWSPQRRQRCRTSHDCASSRAFTASGSISKGGSGRRRRVPREKRASLRAFDQGHAIPQQFVKRDASDPDTCL